MKNWLLCAKARKGRKKSCRVAVFFFPAACRGTGKDTHSSLLECVGERSKDVFHNNTIYNRNFEASFYN
jgi:hypothetical protein